MGPHKPAFRPYERGEGCLKVAGALFDARLYSHDRFGLALNTALTLQACGPHLHLKGEVVRPCNVLSEFSWNAPRIVRSAIDVISDLNEALREAIDENNPST